MAHRTLVVVALASFLLVAGAVVEGGDAAFDFESEIATFVPPGPRVGAYPALSITRGGLTATFYRTSGAGFDIVENSGGPFPVGQEGKPPTWGANSLDPFGSLPPGDLWIVDFSSPVVALSFEAGDYGGDDDATVALGLFEEPALGGALLAVELGGWTSAQTFPDALTLTVASAVPGRSALFGSGGPFSNSLFWDNLRAETLPPRTLKEEVLATLQALVPSGDRKADDRLEKAAEAVGKSLDPQLWSDGDHLTSKGKKVFDEEKKAAKELARLLDLDDDSDSGGDSDSDGELAQETAAAATAALDDLVSADALLAGIALDEALSAFADAGCETGDGGDGDSDSGGDSDSHHGHCDCGKSLRELTKAMEAQQEAEAERAAGDRVGAIERYRHTWEEAIKASCG